MKLDTVPQDIRPYVIPEPGGRLIYRCLGCAMESGIEKLMYTCPNCGQVLLIYDQHFDRLKKIPAELWHQVFDYRKVLNVPAVNGIYCFHEFLGPVIPLDAVV